MTTRARPALMLSVLLFSCSSGAGPTAGVLNVKLSSLRGDDGAVLFTISGGPVESVEAVSGTARSAQIDANTLRVVITGNLSAGAIARVRIADVTQASRYSAAVNQVAARSSYVPRDAGQYSITLAP
ncbi:MAG TPA: hypothetical protein VGR09_10535 [Gemmatimonadales bacterium]|nr:hypothetical protein [Gemmatimonadales bacterium]